jgi:Na+/melibiose symporter-like transporter
MAAYKNQEPEFPDSRYDVGVAYLMVTGISLLLIFAVILWSVAKNVYHMSSNVDEGQHPIAEIVFCAYDHLLTDERTVKVNQLNVAQQLLAQVFEQKSREEYAQKNKLDLIRRRLLVNVCVLAILAISFYAIQATVDRYAGAAPNSIDQLIPSIVVSILNQVVPVSFEVMARFEQWRTPLQTIKWTVVRSILLRIGSLYAFFYTYFVARSQYMVSEGSIHSPFCTDLSRMHELMLFPLSPAVLGDLRRPETLLCPGHDVYH